MLNIFVALFCAVLADASRSQPKRPAFYKDSKHIIELNPSTFSDVVYGSNYTTIVEFYAPWCGYCQQLKPEYEKAAKQGHHYAQFAAVNCDEEQNKQFCQSQRIEGFPTLLTYRPPKTFLDSTPRSQQYAIQTYENERTSSGIVKAMKGTVKSYSKKLSLLKLPKFLSSVDSNSLPKVLMITDKAQNSPMYKVLAVDFKGSLEFFHLTINNDSEKVLVRDSIPEIAESFEVPSLVVVNPTEGVVAYEGEMKKTPVAEFLTRFGVPVEGDFSERNEIIRDIKKGTYKSFKDYRKKAKKAKKAKKENLEKDEL